MAESPGEFGIIDLHFEAAGAEIPVLNAVAYGTSAGGCNYYLGYFKVLGDLAETDTGVVAQDVVGGALRISGNNEDGKGAALATAVMMRPDLNGQMVLEARVQGAALTTRNWFIGFCGTLADDIAEPLTATGTTLTLTATNLCGFLLDSQLTSGTEWHMPYNGGATAGPTNSDSVDSDVVAVAGEWDVLRIEIDPNGTARWYINGVLKQTVTGAVSTTALQGAVVGCWGTEATAADIDLQYMHVRYNRDWTR